MKKIYITLLIVSLSVISAAESNCYTQAETITNSFSSLEINFDGYYQIGVTTNYDPKAKDPLKIFIEIGACIEKKTYGDYTVKIYHDVMEGSFEIIKNGVRVFAERGNLFQVGSIYESDKTNSLITIGTDITGDGKPNLVVSEWSGGNHGYYTFYVFNIGSEFSLLDTISNPYTGSADFENLDDSPELEFQRLESIFAYWRTCFAESPMPKIILKYNGEKYGLAQELMRKPKLDHEKLIKLADKINSSNLWNHIEGNIVLDSDPTNDQPPVLLWKEMLDLIYTGNMDQAWELFNLSWPKNIKGKKQFLNDFKKQLKKSQFWKEIQEMNKK